MAWAAAFNFVAFFIFKDHAVANTISKTVHKEFITPAGDASSAASSPPSSGTCSPGGTASQQQLAHAHRRFAGAPSPMPSAQSAELHLGGSEKDKDLKTVLFIFLAPIVGMLISMFVTLVTLVRTWYRVGIIARYRWYLVPIRSLPNGQKTKRRSASTGRWTT